MAQIKRDIFIIYFSLTRAHISPAAAQEKARSLAVVQRVRAAETINVAAVAIAAVAAVLSPPDPFSMLAMMIPTVGLYEVSIWLVRRLEAKSNGKPPVKA